MPVLDHDVHPSVIIGPDHRYGCWNRVSYSRGYYAPSRQYSPSGSGNFTMVKQYISHAMSTDCRYDMSLTDDNCAECVHQGSGEEYDQRIRSKGK